MLKEKAGVTVKLPRTHRPFIWLHSAWLLLWGGVLVLMLLPFSQAGHPPIIVFWFYPVGYGVFGHLILLGLGLAKRLDDKGVADSEPQLRSWPWPVWIAVAVFTFVVLSGLAAFALPLAIPQFIGTSRAVMPQRAFHVLAWQLPAIMLAAAAIVGIVKRKQWTRIYAPALIVLMALYNITWLSPLLLGYAIWFVRSDGVRAFFGVGAGARTGATPGESGSDHRFR